MAMNKDEIEEVLKDVSFQDWRFEVRSFAGSSVLYLQIWAAGPCNTTGEPLAWGGRKWHLSRHMTRSEIVMTAFKAVMTAVEHETRETFRYKGVSIFDPHYNVDALVELRARKDCLDVRPDIEV